MKWCSRYVGVTCTNGSCPIALREEYEERGMDVVNSCKECPYYKGCEDCAWAGTLDCIKEGGKSG